MRCFFTCGFFKQNKTINGMLWGPGEQQKQLSWVAYDFSSAKATSTPVKDCVCVRDQDPPRC
jgi:hypothetical protein